MPSWKHCSATGCPLEATKYGAQGMVCLYHQNADFNLWPSITDVLQKTTRIRWYAQVFSQLMVREVGGSDGDDREDLQAVVDCYNQAASQFNLKLEPSNAEIRRRNEAARASDPKAKLELEWPLVPYADPPKYGPDFAAKSPPYKYMSWVESMAKVMTAKKTKKADPQKAGETDMQRLQAALGRIWEGKRLNSPDEQRNAFNRDEEELPI